MLWLNKLLRRVKAQFLVVMNYHWTWASESPNRAFGKRNWLSSQIHRLIYYLLQRDTYLKEKFGIVRVRPEFYEGSFLHNMVLALEVQRKNDGFLNHSMWVRIPSRAHFTFRRNVM